MFLERPLCVFVVLGSGDTVAAGLEEQPTPIKSLPLAGQGLGLRPPRELCPRPGTCGAGLSQGLSTAELLSSCCFGTSVLLWFCFYFYFLSWLKSWFPLWSATFSDSWKLRWASVLLNREPQSQETCAIPPALSSPFPPLSLWMGFRSKPERCFLWPNPPSEVFPRSSPLPPQDGLPSPNQTWYKLKWKQEERLSEPLLALQDLASFWSEILFQRHVYSRTWWNEGPHV